MKKLYLGLGILIFSSAIYYLIRKESAERADSTFGKYGPKYNLIRLEKHVPVIEKNWYIKAADSSYIWWHRRGSLPAGEPIHLWKISNFNDEILTSEEDVFHFKRTDEEESYRLVCNYDYSTDSVRFELLIFYHDGRYPPSKACDISKATADSTTMSWRLGVFYN